MSIPVSLAVGTTVVGLWYLQSRSRPTLTISSQNRRVQQVHSRVLKREPEHNVTVMSRHNTQFSIKNRHQ